MFGIMVDGPEGPEGKWKVTYEIGDKEYSALIDDGSDGGYHGHSDSAFEAHVKSTHPGVSIDDVKVVSSIEANHPLANFF